MLARPDILHNKTYDNGSGVVVNLENTVDKQLLSLASDSDTVEDLGKVVGDETVTGPLGEKGEGDDNPHSLEIALGLEQR